MLTAIIDMSGMGKPSYEDHGLKVIVMTGERVEDRYPDASARHVEDMKIAMAYRCILESFPRLGRGPTMTEMAAGLRIGKDRVLSIMMALQAAGAITFDQSAMRIMNAYPYSADPTEHTVHLPSGGQVYCMCAIDAFYVPFLTESSVHVRSCCFLCRSEIEVRVARNKVLAARPATSVIWDSAASDDCPRTNFFCSEEHLFQWRNSAPEEPGKMCSLDAALDRGRIAVSRIREASRSSG
jgi:hypothetical protein